MFLTCRNFVLGIIALIFFPSCLGGIDKSGSVLSYRKGIVATQGGAFRLGEPGADWKQKKIGVRALVFVNLRDAATMTVDAWCRGSYDDSPLASLADQVFLGYPDAVSVEQGMFKLDGREAFRKSVRATLDGMPIYLNLVVLKMNGCVFDFVYVSTPTPLASESDFDRLINGFHFLRGPDIL